MTDEEHKAVMGLYNALMEVPPGSGKDAKPLIEDLRAVVLAYRRASWATRALIWLLPTVAMMGASLQAILNWFDKQP